MSSRAPIKAQQHGTITGYGKGCRCQPCRSANTLRMRERRRAKAYGSVGPHDRVPIDEAQTIVRRLHKVGYTDPQIGRLAGLPDATINRIRRDGRYITRETAERISRAAAATTTVPARDLLAERYVDAIGARRRVQALMTQGWSVEQLGQQLGHSRGYLSPLLYTQRQITPAVHQAVVDLYEQLWRTPGPSSSTRVRALKRGWATPLELDDERIDDPSYVPQLHRLTPDIDRRQRREQTLVTVATLTARGLSARQIAPHIGKTPRSVQRYRDQLRAAS